MDDQYHLVKMLSADFAFLERHALGSLIDPFKDLKAMVFALRIICDTCESAVALRLFGWHWLNGHQHHPLGESDDESEEDMTAVADSTAQYYMVDTLFKSFSFVRGHINASVVPRLDVVKDILSGLRIVCDICVDPVALGSYKTHWLNYHDDGVTLGETDSETDDDESLPSDMDVSQGGGTDATESLVPSANSSQFMDVSRSEGSDTAESLVPSADSSI